MRCDCCNNILSDVETTRRHKTTKAFLNTCTRCLDGLDIPFMDQEEEDADPLYEEWESSYDDDELFDEE